MDFRVPRGVEPESTSRHGSAEPHGSPSMTGRLNEDVRSLSSEEVSDGGVEIKDGDQRARD